MAKRRYLVTFRDGTSKEIGADSAAAVRRFYTDAASVELVEDYTREQPRERIHWDVHTGRGGF